MIYRAVSSGDYRWAAPETRLEDSRRMCSIVAGLDAGYLDEHQLLAPVNVRMRTLT